MDRSRVVVVGDRRLTTADGTIWREDRTKLTLLETVDARVIVGFSGLGQVGAFRTDRWLLETLFEVAPPLYTLGSVLHRLKEKAEERVNTLRRAGAPLTVDERRLSFYVAGYAYPQGDASDPRLAYGILSNFERLGEPIGSGSSTSFEITGVMDNGSETPDPPQAILLGGNHRAVALADVSTLADLLNGDAPQEAIVGKAIAVVRETARRPEAGGTIGEDVLRPYSGLMRGPRLSCRIIHLV
jgi:hypothetical protein